MSFLAGEIARSDNSALNKDEPIVMHTFAPSLLAYVGAAFAEITGCFAF